VLSRWLGATLLLIGLAIGLFWLARLLSDKGLDWAAKFSEVASLVGALTGLLLPAVGKIVEWLRPPAPPSQQEIDSARADLQTALRARWREEEPSPSPSGRITPYTRVIVAEAHDRYVETITRVSPRSARP
jgi:hypothetical protein